MHVIQLSYQRLINKGNYENEKLEIVVQLAEGESPSEALSRAKTFVEKGLESPAVNDMDLRRADRILADPDSFTGHEVKRAQEVRDKFNQQKEEIPF